MPDYNSCIAIGKIVKTIGIKGNLKVIYLTDFPERFHRLEKVFLYNELNESFSIDKNTKDSFYTIEWQKVFDKYLNIKFKGYDSINESQVLVNHLIMIDEKDRVKIEDGDHYYYELVGLEVYDKDKLIGKVKSIVNYGSGDLFNVQSGEKEILIPFHKEFILNIDTAARRIDTELIEGFLD